MSQPGLTVALLFAALWLGTGLKIIQVALHNRSGLRPLAYRAHAQRERWSGAHSERALRSTPPRFATRRGPTEETFRRVLLNADYLPDLEAGLPVTVRYDPEDPYRLMGAGRGTVPRAGGADQSAFPRNRGTSSVIESARSHHARAPLRDVQPGKYHRCRSRNSTESLITQDGISTRLTVACSQGPATLQE